MVAHGLLLTWAMQTVHTSSLPITPPEPIAVQWLMPETPLELPKPEHVQVPTPQKIAQPAAQKNKTNTEIMKPVLNDNSAQTVEKVEKLPESFSPIIRQEQTNTVPAVTEQKAVIAATPAPVTQPRFDAAYLHNPAPNYPALSRRLGESGKVVLKVQVSQSGQALTVLIQQSSGFDRLDEVAKNTVADWQFVPAKRGETAIVAWVLVPIEFSLKS
jgi:periplasmic protein TonB